jgi:Tfp pilus assembly protein PilO
VGFLFTMHISKVSYQKTFNLGSYTSEKIGVELDINEGEDAKLALDKARKLVQEYHIENNKGLYVRGEMDEMLPEVQKQKPEKTAIESLIEDINTCTEIKVLESYRLIAKSKPELQTAYDNHLKKLKYESNRLG